MSNCNKKIRRGLKPITDRDRILVLLRPNKQCHRHIMHQPRGFYAWSLMVLLLLHFVVLLLILLHHPLFPLHRPLFPYIPLLFSNVAILLSYITQGVWSVSYVLLCSVFRTV